MKIKIFAGSNENQKLESIIETSDFTNRDLTPETLTSKDVREIFSSFIKNVDGEDWSNYGYQIIHYNTL